MYKQLKKMRQEEGFTLIELLIVIIILGVLAAIVVFSVTGINDTSKTSACKADYKNVEIAAEAYAAQDPNHYYPTGIGTAADLVLATLVKTSMVGAKLLKEPPSTTNGYTISYTPSPATNPTSYTLTASGACTLP